MAAPGWGATRGGAARLAAAVAVGTLAKAVLSLPLSPPLASVFSGALAGYLSGRSPPRGFIAAAVSSVLGIILLDAFLVATGYRLAGLPGAAIAGMSAAVLAFMELLDAFLAAAAGAAAAGLRRTMSRI